MEYASEKEMIDNCKKYPCSTCVIAYKCTMFEALFGYLPSAPNNIIEPFEEDDET